MPRTVSWILLIACQGFAWQVAAADLVDAAKNNDQERLSRLIDAGHDVNKRGEQGATALHWMAFHGNETFAGLLIDAGAAVDAALESGSTPLHLAAYKGHTRLARRLLENGADAQARTRDGVTPRDWAARNGHQATVDLLAGYRDRSRRGASDRVKPGAAQGNASTSYRPTSPAAARLYRIQLAALSSEQRGAEAIARYSQRFADVLQETELSLEQVADRQRPLYRVRSGPLPSSRAKAMCDQLRSRDQPCFVCPAGLD